MKTRLLLIAIATSLITACSTQLKVSDLNDKEQAAYQRIVSTDASNKDFTVIGEVEGYFCLRDSNRLKAFNDKSNPVETANLSKKTAQDNLRINAAKLDADAVIEESCLAKGVDWARNCWSSYTCKAKAVKLK